MTPCAGSRFAACHEQPGQQAWHLQCALRHPIRFARSRGPMRWRYPGAPITPPGPTLLYHEHGEFGYTDDDRA